MAVCYSPLLAALLLIATPSFAQQSFPVSVTVDAAKSEGRLSDAWRFFGADEPNYATMKDGETLLKSLGELAPGRVYFRTHHLMTSGDGTPALKWGSTNIYSEDAQGNPVYNFTIVDRIFDTYIRHGLKPYVEIGFMPEALSSHPQPYRSDWRPGFDYNRIGTGVSYPPKDYAKWEEMVYQWAKHCVDRYGAAEVRSWYWETWNEANGPAYWKGTPEEFWKLHDLAVAGVRRALNDARVGGPDLAGSGPFLDAFMAHVNDAKTPTDFLSFHAKGSPKYINEPGGGSHVRMNMVPQLSGADRGFKVIAANPQLKTRPIVIGESDPEGCAACLGPSLSYRNGTMYSSYTAATFPRLVALAKRDGANLEGVLTWAFEFEDQPYFAGFRQLQSNGLDLPVLNVFRMYAKMHGDQLTATSSAQVPLDEATTKGVSDHPDVGVLAARDGNTVTVMVWHYFDDDVAGPTADIEVAIDHLPKAFAKNAVVTEYRIDDSHSNSYAVWKKLGSPITLKDSDFDAVRAAGQLQAMGPVQPVKVVKTGAKLTLSLPRQGVSLFVLTPES